MAIGDCNLRRRRRRISGEREPTAQVRLLLSNPKERPRGGQRGDHIAGAVRGGRGGRSAADQGQAAGSQRRADLESALPSARLDWGDDRRRIRASPRGTLWQSAHRATQHPSGWASQPAATFGRLGRVIESIGTDSVNDGVSVREQVPGQAPPCGLPKERGSSVASQRSSPPPWLKCRPTDPRDGCRVRPRPAALPLLRGRRTGWASSAPDFQLHAKISEAASPLPWRPPTRRRRRATGHSVRFGRPPTKPGER